MSKKYNLFTKEEDEFLVENYKNMTGAEIARKLGRNKSTVYYRARKLGLNDTVPNRGDLTGQKFNMLTVISLAKSTRSGFKKWLCKCECGNEKAILQTHLVRGNSRSCGCLHRRAGEQHPNFKGCGEIHQKFFNQMEKAALGRNRTPIPFEITIEEIWELFLKQDRKCALSGMPISFPKRAHEPRTASLDRIDSSKGYVSGNVQWLHKDVNMIKGSFTQEF
jgi:hypothetical protein